MSYRILRRISVGGFSEVFEVEDQNSPLQEVLVLKRLTPEMSTRSEVRNAFETEARLLRELSHPHIVPFRRCFYDNEERVCLLMERIEGPTLEEWSWAHREQPDRLLRAFDKVLDAVAYLHCRPRPILHLDLKPENVLVCLREDRDHPVLLDFGIARLSGEAGLHAHTPPFSAPEQQRGETLSTRTDVYALGQILNLLLDISAEHLDPTHLRSLKDLTLRTSDTSPSRRQSDAQKLRREFRRAQLGHGPTSKPKSTRSWTYAVAAAILTLWMLGGAWAWISSGTPEEAPSPLRAETPNLQSFHRELRAALQSENPRDQHQHMAVARGYLDVADLAPSLRAEMRKTFDAVQQTINLSGPSRQQARETAIKLLGEGEP